MKNILKKLSVLLVVFVFSSISGVSTFSMLSRDRNSDRFIETFAADDIRETTASLNLRSGPGTSYSVIAVMPKGARVTVISVSGNWAKVIYGTKEGYAHTAYLTKVATVIMVTTANLNLRKGPSTSYSIIRVIPNGAEVKVLSTSNGWARIVYSGSEGYASLSYLKLKSSVPPTSSDIRITTEELNLRSGPGTSYSIIAVMPAGAKVTVLSVSGDWAKVTYSGKTGYAHTGYLVKQGTVVSSTVITKGLVSASAKQIALTFDAGWEYGTVIPLLNMLDTHGVKATFFLRALWVKDHPDLAKEIQKRGHSIQNHSLTHPHMKEMTEAEIRKEFTDSTAIFKSVLGITPTLFRPPFGEYNSTVLKVAGEQGYKYTVMWSIDTIDWAQSSGGVTIDSKYITDKVLNNATDKDIVLMHIAYMKTVDALPKMIQTLKDRGYTFKTVPQMVP